MKVSKWGNSLAIRLSAEIIEKLGLRQGDEVAFSPDYLSDVIRLEKKRTLDEMWQRADIAKGDKKIPSDFKFDRDEANSRG